MTELLLIIDPQNDFCPGGALAVPGGDEIMTGINELAKEFSLIAISQDWHPAGHKSFASSHDAEPFTTVPMPYGDQILWPDHCVQGTYGAEFHPALAETVKKANIIIRKGMNPEIDSYSAVMENDRVTKTGLVGYLRELGVTRVTVVGLARNYCVGFSALDLVYAGFDVKIVEDLVRSIPDGSDEVMTENFKKAMIESV